MSNILIADDTRANLRLLATILSEQGYIVRPVTDGLQAISAIRTKAPDLILLDIMMPRMSGYDVCEKLKADKHTRDIPVIFISAKHEVFDKVKAFSLGGVDYITKPFQAEEVLLRVKTHLSLRNLQKRLQKKNAQLQQEIIERKRMEKTLRESQKRLEYAQQVAHIGSWEVDMETHKEKWSDEIYQIFGIDSESFDEEINSIERFVHPDDRDMMMKLQEKLSTGNRRCSVEFRILRPNGNIRNIWAEGEILPNESEESSKMIGIIQDITERRQNEKKLKDYARALEIAKKRAEAASQAKSNFLANMSHEIRTPMNAVMGFTELLGPMVADKIQKGYLDAIRAGGKSLLTLINDILDLSKIEAGKMEIQYEPVSLHSIIEELRHIFSLKVSEKGLKFIADIGADIPDCLLLDEVRLRQILYNLISNAVKFTEKGYIRANIGRGCDKEDKNRLNLIMRVEDTGIGIPAASQKIIFESFKQQDGQSTKKYAGTGLGLAITKKLVEMMGGKISVTSQMGRGSCFEVILHNILVSNTIVECKKRHHSGHESICYEKCSVLIADDVESNRMLIKGFLQDTNIMTIEAENGKKAIDMTKKIRPDLVLMDIRMPVMHGYEAAKQIKSSPELRHIPIIAVTAFALKKDQEKIAKAGFDGYLRKPVQRAELFYELCRFIKYSRKGHVEGSSENPDKEGQTEKLPPESLEKLPEMIHKLENEFMRLWETTKTNEFFNEIECFGYQIKLMGTDYSLKILEKFGKNLIEQAESFDIDNMKLTLASYPELVKKIKCMGLKIAK